MAGTILPYILSRIFSRGSPGNGETKDSGHLDGQIRKEKNSRRTSSEKRGSLFFYFSLAYLLAKPLPLLQSKFQFPFHGLVIREEILIRGKRFIFFGIR